MKPGNAEPQLGSAPLPGNAEPQLGSTAFPGKAEPGLGVPASTVPHWYSRGYLPHCDAPARLQSITFRLADSLPREKLDALEAELRDAPDQSASALARFRRQRIETWLDAGLGCCALRHPAVAGIVEETLLKFDGKRYRLLAWCIMPNHVHGLIDPRDSLARIVQSWKSYTGRWALARNAELGLGVPGDTFWMREYWDRFLRDEAHLRAVVAYIHQNPVNAGLCLQPADWPWSSARHPGTGTPSPSSAGI